MAVRHSFVVVVFLALGLARGQQPYSHPPDAAPPGSGVEAVPTPSADQIRDLIRRAADQDLENDKRQRDYTYVEREQENKLDGKGQVASSESKTHDVMELYGEQVERLIAKDDKPLSSKDAAREEERIEKLIDERKNESEDDRRKRLEKEEKDREQAREFVKEITDAYNFRFAGMERLEGREVYVIDADPRPGYEPRRREAKLLPKFRFRVWIDQADEEWVKLDAECIDTVSVGWFIARVHKGSRVLIEQTRVNDEVWLPKSVALKLDARILLKGFNLDEDVSYRDYKKFRTDTKIVPAVEDPK
jgi:ribosomal protein L17